MTEKPSEETLREYHRSMYRSQLMSLFWSIIMDRKKTGFTLQRLADALRVNKGQVSRWFNGLPNWEANTVSDIAGALNVDIQITARDRATGRTYSATGAPASVSTISSPPRGRIEAPLTAANDGHPGKPFEAIV